MTRVKPLKLHEAVLLWMNQPANRFGEHTCDHIAGWITALTMFEGQDFAQPVTPAMVNACLHAIGPRGAGGPSRKYVGGNFCELTTPWRLRRWGLTALGALRAHEIADQLLPGTGGPDE